MAEGTLMIGDGEREVDLTGSPPTGLYLLEFTAPVPPHENTFARGSDSDGQRRVRSLGQNGQGTARVRIDHTDDLSLLEDAVNDFEDIVASTHRRKGYLRYTWPNGREISYDVEAIDISEAPQEGVRMGQGIVEFVIAFECLPWGRLPEVTIFTGQTFSSPIGGVEVTGVDGHENALAELTLTDGAGRNSDHIEYGLIQTGYVAGEPLQIAAASLETSGFAGSLVSSTIRTDLIDTALATCGTGLQGHQGRHKIRARISGDASGLAGVWLRLAWRRDGGELSYGSWMAAPASSGTTEYSVALAVLDLGEATDWDGQIEAYSDTTGSQLRIHRLEIMPAEIYGVVRRPPRLEVGTTYTVAEQFTSLSLGDLNSQSSTFGGTWAGSTAYDVVDPSEFPPTRCVQRSLSAGTDASSGVTVRTGVSAAALDANVKVGVDAAVDPSDYLEIGLLLRYVNSTNYAALMIVCESTVIGTVAYAGIKRLRFVTVVSGSVVTNAYSNPEAYLATPGSFSTLRAYIGATGWWVVYVDGYFHLSDVAAELATGGALETGKLGLYSYYDGSSPPAGGVFWDSLTALSPPVDHALWQNQSLRITSDGSLREHEDGGDRFGRALVDGDHLTIPPSTEESLPSLLVVKRRDFDIDGALPDEGAAALTGTLTVTPRVALL